MFNEQLLAHHLQYSGNCVGSRAAREEVTEHPEVESLGSCHFGDFAGPAPSPASLGAAVSLTVHAPRSLVLAGSGHLPALVLAILGCRVRSKPLFPFHGRFQCFGVVL